MNSRRSGFEDVSNSSPAVKEAISTLVQVFFREVVVQRGLFVDLSLSISLYPSLLDTRFPSLS